MKWHALILAGSRGPSDPVAQKAGVSHKAFAPLLGKPMISYVLEQLKSAEKISTCAVSIEPDAPALPLSNIIRLDAASTPATSVLFGLEALDTPLLVTTADNPLLSKETLDFFLKQAEKSDADILAAVSPRSVVERAEKPGKRTYLKFSDQPVSGCNLFAVKTPRGKNLVTFWKRLEQNRKRPWKMALEIGLIPLLKYLSGMLHSRSALDHLQKKTGAKAQFVFLDDPYAAHDVDKADDLAFAERSLQIRG